jgi:hypothetical protein
MKICKVCDQDYTKIIHTKDGCKTCYWREYYRAKSQWMRKECPEIVSAYNKEASKRYQQKHKERYAAYHVKYKLANREKMLEYQRNYYYEKIRPERREKARLRKLNKILYKNAVEDRFKRLNLNHIKNAV